MSSQSSERASTASIERTQFRWLCVNKAPAIVSWADPSGQPHSLGGDPLALDLVLFDIQHDPDSNTALFTITAKVAYQQRRRMCNLFLYIYPERIRELSVVDSNADTYSLGSNICSLEFALARCPALVAPKSDWLPRDGEAQSVLASLDALSTMASFRVAFPFRTVTRNRVVSLCEKASRSGCLKSASDAINLGKLYGGSGGKIVEQDWPEPMVPNAPAHAQAVDTAPSYGDPGDRPPPQLSQNRKRRRLDSDDDNGSAAQQKMSLEDICKLGFADMGRRIERSFSELSSRLDGVEQLVRDHLSGAGGPDKQTPSSTLGERMEAVEERVTDVEHKLEVGLRDLAQEFENEMYDARNEFDDVMTVRLEEEVLTARCSLEDFVKDELQNAASEAEEAIREKLSDALLS